MDALFMALGAIDLLAGGILFAQPIGLVKVIAAVMLTKGAVTVVKSLEHY